ncbi:MAG TPA: mycofactocin biosynthesis glycosyltransferase MftF [Acidimicrobiia bacterium]|nr:mycofactocin biosynthesis glycosyltransferase MftF [Acidimicrobiia bacterium]
MPEGFRVALDPGARWMGDGTTLVGGSPIRMLRFTSAGRELIGRLAEGEPVPRSPAAQKLIRRLLDAGLAHPRPPGPPAARDAVTAVVPVRNDAEGLYATLAALGRDLAAVVVDDASADRVTLDACCTAPAVTLLHRGVQGGPAAARNDGWRAASQPFIAFVDANCEPEPGWLDALLPHFTDPEVAAVAPRIVAGAAGIATMAAYESVASPLDLGDREALVRPRSPVTYVPTAALVVRRGALEALGGFDERLTVGEDVDFIWRLVGAGWTVRYEPRAVVRHPIRPSWRAWLEQRYRYGTSAAALARRHGAAVAPAVVSPWTAAAWTLAATGHLVGAATVAGYSVAALTGVPAKLGKRSTSEVPIPSPAFDSGGKRRAHLPAREAVRLAGLGHVRGGLALARAVRRAWPVPAVLLAAVSRRSRPALAAAAVVPPALEWWQRRPALDPVRFVGLRLVDDLAYAAGVSAGCVRERSPRALLPDLRSASARPGAPD